MQKLLAELQAVPALGNVPEDQLEWLINHSTLNQYSQGHVMFEPGQASDEMYILLEGRVRIWLEQKRIHQRSRPHGNR